MDGRCRRHTEHRQSEGVCPFCLREKLTRLSTSSSSAPATVVACNTATTSSGCDASNPHHVGAAKAQSHKDLTLKKSRSLAFVFRKRKEEDKAAVKQMNELDDDGRKKMEIKDKKQQKKKGGRFWSALISGSSGRRKQKMDGDMLHSKTVKEKRADKWVVF